MIEPANRALTVVLTIFTDGFHVDGSIVTADTLIGGAVTSFATTLVIGALLIAIVPEYTDRLTTRVFVAPVWTFLFGFGLLIGLFVLLVLLVVTVVGIPLALLSLVGVALLIAIGSTIVFIAIGNRLVGTDGDRLKPLVVGAVISGLLALTGIGGLIGSVIGILGFGTVALDLDD